MHEYFLSQIWILTKLEISEYYFICWHSFTQLYVQHNLFFFPFLFLKDEKSENMPKFKAKAKKFKLWKLYPLFRQTLYIIGSF